MNTHDNAGHDKPGGERKPKKIHKVLLGRPLRIAETIIRHAEGMPGGFNELLVAIQKANRLKKTNCEIREGMLRNIARLARHPEAMTNLELDLEALIALDTYFSPFGEGLADKPLFLKNNLMESLTESEKVTFLIPSKPRPADQRLDTSFWDAHAHGDLLEAACKTNVRTRFSVEFVPLVSLSAPPKPAELERENWYKLLHRDDANIVSIGAPRASLSSELMLARMFRVPAFQRPQLSLNPARFPFFFCWPPKESGDFQSAFALRPTQSKDFGEDAAAAKELADAIEDNQASAFVCEGKLHPIRPVKDRSWTMYGVIAAQRRPAGQIWLVVSGISGPATYAAAKLAMRVCNELPEAEKGEHPVLWAPIYAEVTANNSGPDRGDNREVLDCGFLSPASVWPRPEPKRGFGE